MTDERLREIAETLHRVIRSYAKELTPSDGDTQADCLSCYWAEFVALLRLAAEYSYYGPNAMKFSRMADELREWAIERDREDSAKWKAEREQQEKP